jgi:hypothetical protein
MEDIKIIHDRRSRNEHPMVGNPDIYTAKNHSNGTHDNTYPAADPAPSAKVADIMEYLTYKNPDYVFNEAAANYGDITAY